ncbi:MAG: hypothetical protein M1823_000821 [Watsoniomyces obsoletus]|nr:MAG: hypothetical protein M1823_000821 [Watsoniomyces obsoletus]
MPIGSSTSIAKEKTFTEYIEFINRKWDLEIPDHQQRQSPSKRDRQSISEQCYIRIQYLWFQDGQSLASAIDSFDNVLVESNMNWIDKPRQEPGTLPATNGVESRLADQLRVATLLRDHLDQPYQECMQRKRHERKSLSATVTPQQQPAAPHTPEIRRFTPRRLRFESMDTGTPISIRLGGVTTDEMSGGQNTETPSFTRNDSDVDHTASSSRKRPFAASVESVPVSKLARNPLHSWFPHAMKVHNRSPMDLQAEPEAVIPTRVQSRNVSFVDTQTTKNTNFRTQETFSQNVTTAKTSFATDPADSFQEMKSLATPIIKRLGPDRIDSITVHEKPTSSAIKARDFHGTRSTMVHAKQAPSAGKARDLYGRLVTQTPFRKLTGAAQSQATLTLALVPLPDELRKAPLRVRYEVLRVSLHTRVDVAEIRWRGSSYAEFWESLRTCPALSDKTLPEKSDAKAWDEAGKDFTQVYMRGELVLQEKRGITGFRLILHPLTFGDSYRLGRQFGFHRFFRLIIPTLAQEVVDKICKGGNYDDCCERIVDWLATIEHQLLDRKWSAFWMQDHAREKKTRFIIREAKDPLRKDVVLFATESCHSEEEMELLKVLGPSEKCPAMTVETMIRWLIYFEPRDRHQAKRRKSEQEHPPKNRPPNVEQMYLKLWTRIKLGLSGTTDTVILNPTDIQWRPDDFRSADKKMEMNDGGDLISPCLARKVAQKMGIETHVPSAFQARIAGAKGVWIVDPSIGFDQSDTQDCLHLTPTQVKWKSHPIDIHFPADNDRCHRLMFEVVKYSKPLRPSMIIRDLLPILCHQGVPRGTVERILREELREQLDQQEAALSDRHLLRKWVHDNRSVERPGDRDQGRHGSLPRLKTNRVAMLLEGGFDPKHCYFLRDLTRDLFKKKYESLRDDLRIPIGRSTSAFCVPDLTGTLKEGEVHLAFSSMFVDARSGFQDTILNDVDVLVARTPALRPCDIQKVRAVVSPALNRLKDVIVFSIKGNVPLAHKLAGGDYDGDRVWICWDPALVEHFENAPLPLEPSENQLGIVQEKTPFRALNPQNDIKEMIRRCFLFEADVNMLGRCTRYFQRLSSSQQSLTDKGPTWFAALAGHLVDRTKQGNRFTEEAWRTLVNRKDLVPKTPGTPAYLDSNRNPDPRDIIDYLKFTVAPDCVNDSLARLHTMFSNDDNKDEDLLGPWRQLLEQAEKDPILKEASNKISKQMDASIHDWTHAAGGGDEWDDQKSERFQRLSTRAYERYLAIQPPSADHPLLEWWRKHATNDDWSDWHLLKASLAYHKKFFKNKFPWFVAAPQLAYLKVKVNHNHRSMDENMYQMFKPDTKFLQRKKDALAAEAEADDLSEDEYESVYGDDLDEIA